MSRSALNALILGKNPAVRSVSVRKKYAARGVRLIFLDSLVAHLLSLAREQEAEREAGKDGGKA